MSMLYARGRRSRLAWLMAGLAVLALPAAALSAQMIICIDVPNDLGGTRWVTNATIRVDGAGGYSAGTTIEAIGDSVGIDALEELSDGELLFSTDVPFVVGETTYDPSDVVKYAPGPVFTLYQEGGAGGLDLPPEANIDEVALDGSGNLLISFDAPVTVGETIFEAADVARVVSGVIQPAPVFRGADVGLTPDVNVIGLEADGSDLYLMFDAPVVNGSEEYKPGTIVRYNAATGLKHYWADPAYPPENATTALSFSVSPSTAPGDVPDGNIIPGTPLTIQKSSPTDIALTWGASCVAPADYAVYEGTLGSWESHSPRVCTTSGTTSASMTAGGGNVYYLIVPKNATTEGGYGFRSDGQWRAVSSTPCLAQHMPRLCD